MKSANLFFITLGLAGACALALLFGNSTNVRRKTADVFQAFAATLNDKPQPAPQPPSVLDTIRAAQIAASEPIAASVSSRQVRLPAIHEGLNYGWIQLPRGTFVELLRNEGQTLLIRYDDMTVRMPQSAVDEGAVILRKGKTSLTRI